MADATKPILTAITLPGSVDVRPEAVSRIYTLAVNATDADSGIDRVELLFDKPVFVNAPSRTLVFSDERDSFADGTSVLQTSFNSRMGAGTYNLVGASVVDKAGNVATYDAAQLGSLGATSFTVQSSAAVDTDLPMLKGLDLPDTISSRFGYLVAFAKASDASSGPPTISVEFDQSFILVPNQIPRLPPNRSNTLVFDNDANRGGYITGEDYLSRKALTFDTTTALTANVVKVTVTDRYGNSVAYDAAALRAMSFDTAISITSDPVVPLIDITGPVSIREGQGNFALSTIAPFGNNISPNITVYVDESSTAKAGTDILGLGSIYVTGQQPAGAFDIGMTTPIEVVDDRIVEGTERLVLRVQVLGSRFANGTDTKLIPIDILDNDGQSNDLLWFQPDLRVFTTWIPDGSGFRYGSFTSAPLDAGVRPIGLYDFTGDGKGDVLLQTADGNVVSVMRAGAGGYAQFGMTGALAPGNRVAGAGDFNADGLTDILFRSAEGFSIARSDGAKLQMSAQVENGPGADWHVAAVDDFNGDKRDDILWRNDNGTNAVWFSADFGFDRQGPQSVVDRSWHLEGSGDFNGDRLADLVWRNDNGAFVIWTFQARGPAGDFDRTFYGNSVGTEWTLERVEDFSGDGRADILWRTPSGELSLWQSNGSAFTSAIDPKGPSAASWTIPNQTLDFV